MILRAILAKFGIDIEGEGKLSRAQVNVDKLVSSLEKVGIALSSAAVVRGVRDFVTSSVQMGSEMELNARRIGVTAEQMQVLGRVAMAAGRDMDAAVGVASTLQERFRDAVMDPRSDPAEQLRSLGLEIPRSVDDIPDAMTLLRNYADVVQRLGEGSETTAATTTLLGDEGRDLLPVLLQGSEGIGAMADEVERLGGGLSTEFVENASEAREAMGRFDIAMTSLRSRIGEEILPAVTDFVNGVANLAGKIIEAIDESDAWTEVTWGLAAALTAVVVILNIGLIEAIASALIAAAPLIALVLVLIGVFLAWNYLVDQTIRFFRDGEGDIAAFVDALGELSIVKALASFFDNLGAAIMSLGEAIMSPTNRSQALLEVWERLQRAGRDLMRFGAAIFGRDLEDVDARNRDAIRRGEQPTELLSGETRSGIVPLRQAREVPVDPMDTPGRVLPARLRRSSQTSGRVVNVDRSMTASVSIEVNGSDLTPRELQDRIERGVRDAIRYPNAMEAV